MTNDLLPHNKKYFLFYTEDKDIARRAEKIKGTRSFGEYSKVNNPAVYAWVFLVPHKKKNIICRMIKHAQAQICPEENMREKERLAA